jgi:hypothetical protein
VNFSSDLELSRPIPSFSLFGYKPLPLNLSPWFPGAFLKQSKMNAFYNPEPSASGI